MKDKKGLYLKYHIEKADGSPIDPNAEYFVLRIDKDPAARFAIRAYARFINNENPKFADDLRNWALKYSQKEIDNKFKQQ